MNELLTWDGEELSGPIVCEDLSPLRNVAVRGTNVPIPGVAGSLRTPRRPDELDVTLVWMVSGRFDPDGDRHTSQDLGVELNLEHYRALFTTGADPDDGSHAVSLAFAGQTFDGDAQLNDYAQRRTGPGTATILTRLVLADELILAVGSA